jgi:hypothetical protein
VRVMRGTSKIRVTRVDKQQLSARLVTRVNESKRVRVMRETSVTRVIFFPGLTSYRTKKSDFTHSASFLV